MFKLEPSQYKGERPGILWSDDLLCASQFGDSEFMAACESIGRFSRASLLRIWTAYTDNKIFMTGVRRTGEPNWYHPVGVALVGILEFANTDPDSVIADLVHDVKEDSPFFQGHRSLVGEFETFTPMDMLTGRYGLRTAKIVMCVSKPEPPIAKTQMTIEIRDRYLHWVYNRVINLYPDVREDAAKTKIRDRIFNLRTECDEERLIRNLIETKRFIVPIAEFAGEAYQKKLLEEIKAREDILTAAQKEEAAPVKLTVE